MPFCAIKRACLAPQRPRHPIAPGCYGAHLTGAGFGGCTVNLVEKPAAQAFAAELARQYEQKTGLKTEIYICKASDGARVV